MKKLLIVIFVCLSPLSYSQQTIEIKIRKSYTWYGQTKNKNRKALPDMFVVFTKNSQNDFVASQYNLNKKVKKLKEPITIEASRVNTFENWLSLNKRKFKLSELRIDSLALMEELPKSNLLTFDVEKNIVIKIDTFLYCNQFTQGHSSADQSVISRQDFIFTDSSGIERTFSFRGLKKSFDDNLGYYLWLYQIFENRIPQELISLFNKESMTFRLMTYFTTIECEDYYYQEYVKKHPEKTRKEIAMRVGWDFKEYMINEKGWKR